MVLNIRQSRFLSPTNIPNTMVDIDLAFN